MYSGSISTGATGKDLFFIFQPTINEPVDEITIWLNGGPGCSSLEGFLEENGRFLFYPGDTGVSINDYSWVNLTNVLWVEQPVTVGYSQGTAGYTREEQLAKDFVGFLKNFQTTFGISNFKIYVTGESYAGR
jgi:carboxypeptidase D